MYTLKTVLTEMFHCEIDLVRFRSSLPPFLKQNIEKEGSVAESWEEFLEEAGTKRYTEARIRRMAAHILMDLTGEQYRSLRDTFYARVLGFSETGGKLLRLIRRKGKTEVISNLSGISHLEEKTASALSWDKKAADLRNLLAGREAAEKPSPMTAPMLMTAPIMMTADFSMVTPLRMRAPGSILAFTSVRSRRGIAEFRMLFSISYSWIRELFSAITFFISSASPMSTQKFSVPNFFTF